MKGKLIVIEGTDYSGKQTQTELLVERLERENYKVIFMDFPSYDTPTGKIVGGPYLGKSTISESWFNEGAINVDPKVACLYYAADRRYNLNKINQALKECDIVFLDRYTTSNMGHQGGKLRNKEERLKMYEWINKLEYELLELPVPNLTFLLYMPYENALELKKLRSRNETPDNHESSEEHLKNAELAYLELKDIYRWDVINCVKNNKIREIIDINDELYKIIKKEISE
jgi:dTMP kinase